MKAPPRSRSVELPALRAGADVLTEEKLTREQALRAVKPSGVGAVVGAAVRFVSVAVPVPQLDALTYVVPDGVSVPPAGARVRVPIGTRVVTGCVVGTAEPPAPGVEAKPLQEVLDQEPFIPPAVV